MSVAKLNIATCNTCESDAGNSTKPLEAFSPLDSFRVKWITLYEIIRKGLSLTSTVFKTRKRNIMKMFKIKTDRKLPRVQRNPKWRLMWKKLSRSIWTSSPYGNCSNCDLKVRVSLNLQLESVKSFKILFSALFFLYKFKFRASYVIRQWAARNFI